MFEPRGDRAPLRIPEAHCNYHGLLHSKLASSAPSCCSLYRDDVRWSLSRPPSATPPTHHRHALSLGPCGDWRGSPILSPTPSDNRQRHQPRGPPMERLGAATSTALFPRLAARRAAAGVVTAPAAAAAGRLSAAGVARPSSTLTAVTRSAAAAAASAAIPRVTPTAASPTGGCGRGSGGGRMERGEGGVTSPRAPAANGADEPRDNGLLPTSPWLPSPVGLAWAGHLGGGAAPVVPPAATAAVAAASPPSPSVTTLFSAAASTTDASSTSLMHASAGVAVSVGTGGGASALPLSPHPPLSLAGILAGAITDTMDWLWDGILRAVPKKKVPHGRKRRRMTGKYLKPALHIIECKTCGRWKRAHTYCKPSCVGRQELGV